MKRLGWLIILIVTIALTSGCASKPPTIAHTHIGHAMTAWHDTPGQDGLMVVADKKAREAKAHADKAGLTSARLDQLKQKIAKVLNATDLPGSTVDNMASYGLKQALIGAVDHVTYAADSSDATQNVKKFASSFSINATDVIDRCDLITALGNDIISSESREEAGILFQEVVSLANANLMGIDSNGDGKIGGSPDEYGVRQLGSDLQKMIDNEDPPYSTVDRWYLFNLIRLPSGEWIFQQKYDWDDTGGGGGGY